MTRKRFSSCDFAVQYNPQKDKTEDITKRILYSIVIKRIKHKKPAILFIAGDSGEGKSYSALRLQEVLLELQGLDIRQYLDKINVFTPLEYPNKLESILYDKELKKVNIICMHEAREVVKAKNWQSFLTQSIADINAMSRAIKRLCVIIISQFIRDITTDVRYTLNYYIKISRPKGKRARLYINVMWKDDRDLEKPKLRKRKLSGYLIYPNGKWVRYVPQYLELAPPSKEIAQQFDKLDVEAKSGIIRRKISKLIKDMQEDIQNSTDNNKINAMVEWYVKHPENLVKIGRQRKGKWKLGKEAKEMHDLSKREAIDFEQQLNEQLKKQGVIKEEAA